MLNFEWDPTKAKSNLAKHDVAFEEAKTVFNDESALVIPDPEHSTSEERLIILGRSLVVRILVVVHCYRRSETVIRIISARKAGWNERMQYFERLK